MSVSNGSVADENTFNGAFVSKSSDSTVISKIDLNNVDVASGAAITNIQKKMNDNKTDLDAAQVDATQALSDSAAAQSDITNHEASATAHDAVEIVFDPSATTLIATNEQAAIVALDIKAESNNTNKVGLAGDETITGVKTFSKEIVLTEIATPSNPAATKHKIYPKNDGKIYRLDSGGTETELGAGGGGGGLDDYHTEDFETTKAADFTKDQHATFLSTGGTFGGVLSDETSAPLSKLSSLKYVAGAASTNDWMASPAITLALLAKANDNGITLYYTWDGTADIQLVIWDITNAENLLSTLDVVTTQTSATRFSTTFFPPSTATTIKYGFHFINTPTNGDILIFDNLVLSTNPFTYKNLIVDQEFNYRAAASSMTSSTSGVLRWGSLSPSGDNILSYDDSNGRFTAIKECMIDTSVSAWVAAGSFAINVKLNGNIVGETDPDGTLYKNISVPLKLSIGDYITYDVSATVAGTIYMSTTAIATTEHIVTPTKLSNQYSEANGDFTVTGTNWTTDKAVILPYQSGDGTWRAKININGSLSSTTTANFTGTISGITFAAGYTDGQSLSLVLKDGGATYRTSRSAIVTSSASTFVALADGSAFDGITLSGDIELDSKPTWANEASKNFLAAIPIQKVAYVNPDATNYSNSVTATASYKTRSLNNIIGNTDFLSISSNILTLDKGLYTYELPVGGTGSTLWVDFRLYNNTLSNTYEEMLNTIYSVATTPAGVYFNTVVGEIEISSETDFVFQTVATGFTSGLEYIGRIKITKLR